MPVCVGWSVFVLVLPTLTHARFWDALFAVCSRLVSVFLMKLHFNV